MGRTANPSRIQLGPFWLHWRAEREQWVICWYDAGKAGRSRRICRKATGVGATTDDGKPPKEAQDALVEHYAAWRNPAVTPPASTMVETLLAHWLLDVAKRNADPIRARDAASHWFTFFAAERRAGHITSGPYVADIKRSLIARYIEWRQATPGKRHGSTVSGATISRELAAIRAALRWAWQNELIPSAPFIPDLEAKDKARPKELVYTPEQVARLLEAAWRKPERRHVHLFVLLMLSTHGRAEAILELEAEQIRDGVIHFNAAGRAQTKKRRSIVPIAPTLAPWLADADGKVIRFRQVLCSGAVVERPAASVKKAFEACLLEAGISQQAIGSDGKPAWIKPNVPKLKGIGSPNTLRHTIATELHTLGVPEAQIDAAAGHAGTGTNTKNYRHLRPGYLGEFVEGVEAFWAKVDRFTSVHRWATAHQPK